MEWMMTKFFFRLCALLIPVVVSCSGGFTLVENPAVETIGIPVRSVNWVRLHEGKTRDGKPEIYSTMGQNAESLFMLRIDPSTGAFKQYSTDVPNANYPTATMMSRDGRLYIGAAYAGHLLRYDPAEEALTDLGALNPEKATFPCAIDEDKNGIVWIGSYGACDLTSYNPKTGEFTRCGRMDDTDMYNYPMVNADGMICCKIMMTRPHLVVFDPKTSRKEVVGPVAEKNKDSFNLVRGPGGRVYIASSLGNYRIEGFKAIKVDTVPEPEKTESPAGLSFSFADGGQQLYRKLQVTTRDGATAQFDIDYNAAGNDIFVLHRGPDDCVYGSSILPLHLFRFSPADGSLADMGKCSAASGEAYSMANLDGSIYISSYPGARMSVYDPARPYHYGETPDDNPRELGRIDDISYRPRSSIAGPLGKVWLASIPDYGVWGGPLSCYDPKTGEKKAYYRTAGDASCYTLALCEKQGLIAVGTTISGGSGTQPKVETASLFLWDYAKEEKVWEGVPDKTVTTINALCAAPDGMLFGTSSGGKTGIFAFNPETRVFDGWIETPEGAPLDLGLQNGPDGFIYGFTSSCFYRFSPAKRIIEVIARNEGVYDIAGPILGKKVYFGDAHELKAITLFR